MNVNWNKQIYFLINTTNISRIINKALFIGQRWVSEHFGGFFALNLKMQIHVFQLCNACTSKHNSVIFILYGKMYRFKRILSDWHLKIYFNCLYLCYAFSSCSVDINAMHASSKNVSKEISHENPNRTNAEKGFVIASRWKLLFGHRDSFWSSW